MGTLGQGHYDPVCEIDFQVLLPSPSAWATVLVVPLVASGAWSCLVVLVAAQIPPPSIHANLV